MKEHHVYIPTAEEIADANERNSAKIRRIQAAMQICELELEQLRERLDRQNGTGAQ